jgi:hypothetical protein
MPNILKRPMFRRGGSTSAGVGITSGMESRRNFAEGPDELQKQKMMLEYADKLKSRYDITEGQRIGDFLTAFGATGASDKPLTVGQAIGQATTGYAQLQAGRRAARDKAEATIDAQLLKIFGSDSKITAAMTNAKEYARTSYKDYPGKNYQEKYDAAYKAKFKELVTKQRAAESPATIIGKIAQDLQSGKSPKAGPLDADAMAKTIYKVRTGDLKIKIDGFIIKDQKGAGGIEDIIIQGDGKTAIMNKDAGYTKISDFEREYVPNKNYLHSSGSVYQYQGGGKFKRIYP